MTSHNSTNMFVEPHQKHVVRQSDLETALHTLLDHLRGSFLSMKSDAPDFHHVFNNYLQIGARKPKNRNGGYAHVFAPRIDMRGTSNGYFIDIELPGVHDASSLSIAWRSSASSYEANGFEKNEDPYPSDTQPVYVVADEANGFEKIEDLDPSVIEHSHSQARSQANPFIPSNQQLNTELFPTNIVDGLQLNERDGHRVQVPMPHLPNVEVVTIGEWDFGRFMRCFVFSHRVDGRGLRSGMVDGSLKIGVPKVRAAVGEHGYHISEFGRVD